MIQFTDLMKFNKKEGPKVNASIQLRRGQSNHRQQKVAADWMLSEREKKKGRLNQVWGRHERSPEDQESE